MVNKKSRPGHLVMNVDNDLAREIESIKGQLEEKLGRSVSYPFVTNFLSKIIPQGLKIKEIDIDDKQKVAKKRKIHFVVTYKLEEI